MEEEIKQKEVPCSNKFENKTILPDKSGFKAKDGNIYKYDKYGGWYDNDGTYYNLRGHVAIRPKSMPHDPEKFKKIKTLEDGSGFQLETGEIIFYTNEGGWYDEYYNYYNESCEPAKSPKFFEDIDNLNFKKMNSSGIKESGYLEEDADDENDFDQTIERNLTDDNVFVGNDKESNKQFMYENYHKSFQNKEKIKKLKDILSAPNYPVPIKIFIDHVSQNFNEKEFRDMMKKQINQELNIKSIEIQMLNSKSHFNSCLITVLDKESAYKIIELQGQQFSGQIINFIVESSFLQNKSESSEKDDNDLFSSDQLLDKTIDKNRNFKSGDEDSIKMDVAHQSDLPPKLKKDKNSLHILPKLDKTQLYFSNSNTTPTIPLKTAKKPIDLQTKNYFYNQNLKRLNVQKPRNIKDQNKSITTFLDITATPIGKIQSNQNYQIDDINEISKDLNYGLENKEENIVKFGSNYNVFDNKEIKLHTKHKNSCGNSSNWEKKINEKFFRPSVHEYGRIKEINEPKNEPKNIVILNDKKEEFKINENSTADIVLTEHSDTNINELPNPKPIHNTHFSRDILLTQQEEFFKQKNAIKNDKNDVDLTFLIKNKDTGEIFDIREYDKINSVVVTNKQEYFDKLKKRQNIIWQEWWQKKKENIAKMIESVKNNNIKEIMSLFDPNQGDLKPEVNAKDINSWSALHYSCLNGNYEIVLFLLKNDANIEITTNTKQTPLMVASQKGHESIVSLLLTSGCEINAQDYYDNTALHYACIYNYKDVVATLIARPSVNPYLKNKENKCPLDLKIGIDVASVFENYFIEIKKKQDENRKILIHKANPKNVERLLEVANLEEKNTNSSISFSKAALSLAYSISKQSNESNFPMPLKSNTITSNNSVNDFEQITSSYYSTENSEEKVGPNSFNLICMLGKGSFGEVYLVEKNVMKTVYAMKVLHKQKILKNNLVKYAMTERNVLSLINHPFIVKLNYAFQTDEELFLILDYCPGGDLGKYLIREKKFTEERAKIYICEILLALEHLHQRDIIYRDLKPDNVVLDLQGHTLLTDFGLSKEGVFDHVAARSFCGSIAYLAPEMLKQTGHGKAVDWYLLGVLLYEMLVGTPPYYSINREEIFKNIEGSHLNFPNHISLDAKSLLGSGKNDANEIKSHKFFDGIVWDDVLKRKLKPPKPYIFIEKKIKPIDVDFSQKNEFNPHNLEGWSFINSHAQNGN